MHIWFCVCACVQNGATTCRCADDNWSIQFETSASYFPSSSWYQITFSSFMQKPTEKPLKLLYSLVKAPGNAMLQLYLSLVRPHLDYAASIGSPHMKKDITQLENVQKFALRMATRNWDCSYQDLLELVDLPTP